MATKTIKKKIKMEKKVKLALFIFLFLLELSDLEEVDESFEKSKRGRVKTFDFHLMLFVKNLKEVLAGS